MTRIPRKPNAVRRMPRNGFSLLEVLLALGLSVVVLGLIAAAVDNTLRMLDERRTNVEKAQLARAVLRQIASDLRSSVQYEPVDLEGIESMSATEALTGVAPATLPSAGAAAELDFGSVAEEADEQLAGIASTLSPATIPGLYGNQFELQVDVSRLPRLDEYEVFLRIDQPLAIAQIPSDVKTVAYYLQATPDDVLDPLAADVAEDTSATAPRGLVRRELDRAVTTWAMNNGNLESLQNSADLLAPEVTAIEFRYFDGQQWLLQWDSEVEGGLPIAVEIALSIAPDDPLNAPIPTTLLGTSIAGVFGDNVFRMVVQLPVGKRQPDESANGSTGLEELGL